MGFLFYVIRVLVWLLAEPDLERVWQLLWWDCSQMTVLLYHHFYDAFQLNLQDVLGRGDQRIAKSPSVDCWRQYQLQISNTTPKTHYKKVLRFGSTLVHLILFENITTRIFLISCVGSSNFHNLLPTESGFQSFGIKRQSLNAAFHDKSSCLPFILKYAWKQQLFHFFFWVFKDDENSDGVSVYIFT